MTDHYFTASPGGPRRPRTVRVRLDERDVELASDASVFSADRLDPGTRVLLTETPAPRRGVLLDLGCGYGVIACVQAQRQPDAEVWAVDVNERARELCRRNAVRNHLDNIVVAGPDEVPDDIRFSTIWSNPPIRIGKPALRELLLRWLARLDDDGTATLVVQKHLGADSLQRWLTVEGHRTERLASKSGFRLLEVSPRGAEGPERR